MNGSDSASTGRMWVRIIKGHRTTRDLTIPCQRTAPLVALQNAMHTLDLSMPVWLLRHQQDWDRFALTRLLPEHFVDSVDFDRMDISYIAPEETRKPNTTRGD